MFFISSAILFSYFTFTKRFYIVEYRKDKDYKQNYKRMQVYTYIKKLLVKWEIKKISFIKFIKWGE